MMNEVEASEVKAAEETEKDAPADENSAANNGQGGGPSPGGRLKQLRESAGLSQAQVAEALHLTVHYIKALENDNFQKLPGRTFAKGYLRNYARYLGADEGEIIGGFESLFQAVAVSDDRPEIATVRRRGDQHLPWVIGAAFLGVVILLSAWWFGHEPVSETVTVNFAGQGPTPPQVEAAAAREAAVESTGAAALEEPGEPPRATALKEPGESAGPVALKEPLEFPRPAASEKPPESGDPVNLVVPAENTAAAPPTLLDRAGDGGVPAVVYDPLDAVRTSLESLAGAGSPANPAAGPHGSVISLNGQGDDLLVVHFTGTSWIEVDNRENVRLYNDNLHEGDELTIRGEAPFNVLIGNARMVELVFNSKTVDLAPRMRSDNSARILLE